MSYQGRITIKGQVTVPLEMRRALGLEPGQSVQWEFDDKGGIRLTKADEAATLERRRADFCARLKKAQAIFKANDAFPGMSTDDFMAMIREPFHDFEAGVTS